MSSLKESDVVWGWVVALIACISFGSFGVPIKGESAKSVDIDPLVFQTYKTCVCFMTSWIVLLLGAVRFYSRLLFFLDHSGYLSLNESHFNFNIFFDDCRPRIFFFSLGNSIRIVLGTKWHSCHLCD